MINVGLVFGGKSVEHDVSIITYFQVLDNIDRSKYNIIPIYMDKDNLFISSKKMFNFDYFKNKIKDKEKNFIRQNGIVYFNRKKIDIVILLVHGKDLENGILYSFFNILDIPVVSPNIYTSSCFHNKFLTKVILEKYKINVVDYIRIKKDEWEKDELSLCKTIDKMGKVIIKPTNLGSSIGVNKCINIEEVKKNMEIAFSFDNEVLVEKCLESFLELNQACYRSKDELKLSRIEEIKTNFYGFKEKYECSSDTKKKVPAKIPISLKNKIYKYTKKIMNIFNNLGLIRIDYLYDNDLNKLFVNEINVIPGALSYYLFETKEISFKEIIDELIKEAFLEYEKNKNTEYNYLSSIINNTSDIKKLKMKN